MREALRRAASNRWEEMTPEQAVEEVSPVLRAGAEAVAESLATGKPLKDTRLAVPLEQAFLAESPDASEEAQARCRAIREAFAEELEMAVKADAAAQAQKLLFEELSEVDTRPVLRVEVRGTAGRSLIDRAVAVGSKPECDVQVFGDEGVRPLQFLVVSLSTCTVIADFSGETCATWRSSMRQHEHNGLGVPGATFMIAPGERVVLQVGHSSVALGPPAPNPKARKKAARTFDEAFSEEFPAKSAKKCLKSSSASTSCGSFILDESTSKPDIYTLRSDSDSPIGCDD